jgi:hypothetical protein
MSRIHIITRARLQRALKRILPELARHGFRDQAVAGIVVYLVPLGDYYGWQNFGAGGEIGIPSVSLARLRDWWQGSYTALADVLRHEHFDPRPRLN